MTEWNPPRGRARAAPGWYADPWGGAPVRWWNGHEWTGYTAVGANAHALRPRTTKGWIAFGIAAVIGLAVWIATVASQPRYDYDHVHDDGTSLWYFVIPVVAAVVLGALFADDWQSIAFGLVLPQLLLAPFTTPRGDNDGLWVLIVPMIVVFGVFLHLVAGCSSAARRWVSARRVAA